MGRGCLEMGDPLGSHCINPGQRRGALNLGGTVETEGDRVKIC